MRAAPAADAELIRLCDRLVVNRALEAAAYEANPDDDDERAFIADPIDDEWFQLRDQIVALERPRTLEGARAMALAALSEVPRNRDGTIDYGDLHSWLSIGCARYLAGEVV